VHLDAIEHGDKLVFMHAVKDGPADRSFGLQVAALAGLPRSVVAQAKRTLAELEARAALHAGAGMTPAALDSPQQMGLFAPPASALLDALEELDPDQLTPRQAHEALYRLRQLR
jgi:DNA mismatch repair protein MutS